MKRRITHPVLSTPSLLLCALAVAPHGALASAAEEPSAADSAALRLFWSTVDASWNERDAEQFSELFTEDGRFAFVDLGTSLDGREAIHESFAGRFPGFAPELRHLTSVHGVEQIAPGVCAVDGEVEILRTDPAGEAVPTVLRRFEIFAVMLQAPEGWKIRVLRAYPLPIEDPAAG